MSMLDESRQTGINADEGPDEALEPDIPAVDAAAPVAEESGLSARVLLARVRQARHHEVEEG